MSDINDINASAAAASAETASEQKAAPARRNAATQGAPRGAGSHTAKQGRVMLGAEAVIASLEAEGVTTVFGYPGGQAIKLYDALYDSDQITHVLARHEQGAVHMADGYARSTGRAGVAIVTSGPGATNTVTGIATAYMDSVPLVVITGQVGRGVIGTDSFQESDIVGITMPVVKHSYLLQSTDELTATFREAFHIAKTGRPGPVLIDVPSDLASEELVFEYPDEVNLPSYKPTYRGNAKQVKQAVARIRRAERPVLYVGGGVVSSGAFDNFLSACQGPSLEQLAQVGVDCSKISPSFEGALIMIQMGTAMSIVPCLSTAVIPGIVKVPLLDFPPVTVEIAAMRHAPRLEVQSFIEIAKQKYAHPHDPLLMETLI